MSATCRLDIDVTLALGRFPLQLCFVAHARVLGIVGASGSGKTSFLETLVGLRPAARGRITVDDEVWLDSAGRRLVPPHQRHIGYVPQDGLLLPHLDVRRNLVFGRPAPTCSPAARDKMVREVIAILDLEPLLERCVTTLSGGEQQRVALGRALCTVPRLLVLDEPLAALDLPLRRRLLLYLCRVRDALALPIVFVSHDLTEVELLSDHVLVLARGELIARGAPASVLSDARAFALSDIERGGYENLLPCRVLASEGPDADLGLVELAPGIRLYTRSHAAAPNQPALVGIPARDIILALTPPSGVSARNLIPAQLATLVPMERRFIVGARVHPDVPLIHLEISARAQSELSLACGQDIFLLFKAAACTLYPARP